MGMRLVMMRLQVGDVTQVIQVESAAASVEVESSDRGQVVNHEAVANLPMNGRSSASLALLAPFRNPTALQPGTLGPTSGSSPSSVNTSATYPPPDGDQ